MAANTNEQAEELDALHAEKIRAFNEKIRAMDKDELGEELELLKEDLEDVGIERRLIIGQTGVHINAVAIEAYRQSFDREASLIKDKMDLVKQALGA
ncbi:MAG: hypothetical protein COW32_06630 [Candidatus Aquicultor secundus]|uniref:Uncharacterized protein n=1 Tax=Candidatus Aquicultor secundus TaxID=1973895 RepID=A0A2M7T6A2_9ACTN|nr:hypothetical protein [Candidatus Aquicultor secundus]NCO66563.1 hypothetical protein [Solirubrobacter sp.]OIO83433.1 MAG: hypothetical protein AUK32_10065 [Candidatus Aquicultor secundus]PIU27140.1 MAG: hypothetical protein COT10_05070 [Candidatus Aquicultor secundus]PIW22063.1 MAG: hypothetical protein COW32_06630 [Candidatus Aquicultor secundus]PIX52988.1 MAG: hypothetical protein COZ51_01210 [Candidatus Aquicultor secundus]